MPRMEMQKQLRYLAGPDDVFTMLCDEAFRTEVAKATHARDFDVSITSRGGRATVRISRVMATPDLAKKLVGDTMEVVQVEDWGLPGADTSRHADWSLEIPGKPGSMHGTMALTASGEGTIQSIRGQVSVKIPLVGGKLEKEITKAVESGIRTEGEIGTRWLAR